MGQGVGTYPAGGGPWAAQPRVIAHRGFQAGGAHENTLEAFAAAMSLGADVVELDVRKTRDGVLVVLHDPQIYGRRVAELDYAQLPVLPGGARIPRLDEVTALAARRGARLSVELKEKDYEREVAQQIGRHLPVDRFELISFDRGSIRTLESWAPQIRTGLLEPRIWESVRESAAWPWIVRVIDPFHPSVRAAQNAGADFLSVDDRTATPRLLDAAHRAGIPVDVWTINDPREMARLISDPRVHGIITDRPDLAMAMRGAAPRIQAVLGAARCCTGPPQRAVA